MSKDRRWGFRELVASWVAYWGAVAIVKLGPAALAAWHATHLPGKDVSSISLGFANDVLELVIKEHDVATWQGHASLAAIGLWVAAGPLVTWGAWLATRRRRKDRVGVPTPV